MGRPLPAARTAPPPTLVAQAPDVPLVPIPPPPLARPDEAKPPAPSAATPTSNPPPPAADTPPPPMPPVPAATPGVTPRQLYQSARERFGHIDSYIVRLIRREMVKGEMNPEEVILFKFRKEPWSFYLKWLGKEGQGREVVYVKGRYEGKIHTLLAAGDVPLVPAGRRMALAPDSVLVRSACRHPITSAGFGACIARIGALVAAQEKGDRTKGSLRLVGPVNRPEFEAAAYALEHTLPPGLDATLPRGGKRTYFFDPDSALPTLVMTRDENDREVEYYRHDRLQPAVKLDDEDFDPDRLWGKPKAPPRK
jgi:hypothetical protein